jgi:penicillin-binding protein 1A
VKAFSYCLKMLVAIAVGAAALAVSVALMVPATRALGDAATPIGRVDLKINAPAARSIVYDRYGNIMGSLAAQDRAPVKLKAIPKVLINAVIAIEDRDFFAHNGVDIGGSMRALFKNVDAGGVEQGGSTITQQLVKNALTTSKERDLKTKFREALLATRLEDEVSKNEILEDYLNLIYFGNGAYGVQAAAERYFTDPAHPNPLKDITLAQAALLAGLIQAPEALNPIKFPDRAARRRGQVLDAMVATRKISLAKAERAKAVPLPTKVSYPVATPLDYYKDEIKNRLLIDDPDIPDEPSEVLGTNQQRRANVVRKGGLKIHTSYDPYVQLAASRAVAQQLPQGDFTASLVAIDNADGGVRAIANGRTFQQSQFNPATEGLGRQAGSAFKVFTMAAALSRGYSPNDSVSGASISWRLGPGSGKDAFYHLSGDCHGSTRSMKSALAISDNCAWVRTELSLGPENYGADGAQRVIEMARTMGIDTSEFLPVVSTTLGTNGVHPLEMAQAYSVFPNDGVLKRATFVTKIVNSSGKVLYQADTTGHRVLDPEVARTGIDLMTGVVRDGTASGSLGSMRRPIAGKTGTTDANVDAWFVGFTAQYTAAVWMGHPDGEVSMRSLRGGAAYGGTYPARIWRAFMEPATQNLPAIEFTPPDEEAWPDSEYIDEYGRDFSFSRGSRSGSDWNGPVVTAPPAPVPTTVGATPTTNGPSPPTTRKQSSPATTAAPPPPTTPATEPPGP